MNFITVCWLITILYSVLLDSLYIYLWYVRVRIPTLYEHYWTPTDTP